MKQRPFSYRRIIERRNHIFSSVLTPYIGRNLTGDTVYEISNALLTALPNNVVQTAVFDSVRLLAGTTLTRQRAGDFAWRIAGNVDRLVDGLPVLNWTKQIADERVPVIVENVRPFMRKRSVGFMLQCRAVGGTPCPMTFPQFFSRGSCIAISQTLGFSAPWGPYPYSTPYHFVNLLFFAHVEAARSYETPVFSTVSASASMIKHNRSKIEVRCRAKLCPQNFEHACVHCWLGYDQCQYATHAKTYVSKYCDACKMESFFDPADAAMTCVRCKRNSQSLETAVDQ